MTNSSYTFQHIILMESRLHRVAEVRQSDPNFDNEISVQVGVGIVVFTVNVLNAPLIVNALPSSIAPVFKLTAPLLATIVPLKTVLVLMFSLPSKIKFNVWQVIIIYVMVTNRAPNWL